VRSAAVELGSRAHNHQGSDGSDIDSDACPKLQLRSVVAYKGSLSGGGLLRPDGSELTSASDDEADSASDDEAPGASSSRPSSVSRKSPAKQPSAHEVCPGTFVLGLQSRWAAPKLETLNCEGTFEG
jgi:hypothetical protein